MKMKIALKNLRSIIKEEIKLHLENQYKSIEETLADLNPNESLRINIYTPTRGVKNATVTKEENIGFMKDAFGDYTYKIISDDGSIETSVNEPGEFKRFFALNGLDFSF